MNISAFVFSNATEGLQRKSKVVAKASTKVVE